MSDAGESLPGQGEFSLTTFDLKIAAGARGCLIDTSIWVEALRSRDRHVAHPVTPVIQEISEADFIYTSRLIVAEIMAGARTRREAEKLEDDFQGFRFCDEDLIQRTFLYNLDAGSGGQERLNKKFTRSPSRAKIS